MCQENVHPRHRPRDIQMRSYKRRIIGCPLQRKLRPHFGYNTSSKVYQTGLSLLRMQIEYQLLYRHIQERKLIDDSESKKAILEGGV